VSTKKTGNGLRGPRLAVFRRERTRRGRPAYPERPGAWLRAPDPARRATAAGGAGRRSSERRAAAGSRLHHGARFGRCHANLRTCARHARAEDPARRCHQGRHGGVRPRADGFDRRSARRARARGGGPFEPGPRPLPGPLPNEQHGRRRQLDGESRHAVAGARRSQHRQQAMLVGPEQACGAYIGFVGPA
jgi:hypothetical protein